MLRRTVVPSFLLFEASSCSSPDHSTPTFSPSVVELIFLETSALTGENVEEGFLKCARIILNKIDSGERVIPAQRRVRACGGEPGRAEVLNWFVFDRRVGPREDGLRDPVRRRITEAAATAARHRHTE